MESTWRVAVRIDGDPVAAYVGRTIEELAAVEAAEVVLVVVDPTGRRPGRSRAERWYDRVERLLFRAGPSAMATRPLPGAVTGAVARAADPKAAWELVVRHRADVLIDLAARPLPDHGVRAEGPRLGCWHLRYAAGLESPREDRLPRTVAPDGLAVVELEAQLAGGHTATTERVIGALPLVGHVRSRDALLWAASNLPARALRRAIGGRSARDAGARAAIVMPPAGDPAAVRPSSGPGWASLVPATVRRVAERAWFHERWVVLTRAADRDGGPPSSLRGFEVVPAPRGHFYADPFVLGASGTSGAASLFVEVSRAGRHEGSIAVLERRTDGSWGAPRPVVSAGRHLAYPHVIVLQDGPLLTPDDGAGAGVTAYRPDTSGGPWKPVATLLAGVRASDPTLLSHGGRLWLFVAQTTHGMSPWNELHLYSAPALEGPWEAHPDNPVVADVRCARPAGRILVLGGRLVRPGQDCTIAYGRRIVLSEITRLDRESYAERPIGTIEPTGFPGARRTHTYSVDGDIEAVDAFVRHPRLVWHRRSHPLPAQRVGART